MNKVLKIGRILNLLFLFHFLLINSVYAKSGCCSGHGGVDCGAGAQSNGKVICNDGWRGSSCLYSEMVMCGGSSGSTITVKTVQSTSTPRPTSVPKKVPTVVPTKTPTVILTTTPILTPTSTLSPTLTPITEPTKTEEISPTSIPQPQVLGENITKSTKPLKTSDYIIGFSFLGLIGFGIYKLIIKIKNKIKNFLKKND